MKIFYAVQATGNGHISRAMELLPYFQRYGQVDIFLSGANNSLQLDAAVTAGAGMADAEDLCRIASVLGAGALGAAAGCGIAAAPGAVESALNRNREKGVQSLPPSTSSCG